MKEVDLPWFRSTLHRVEVAVDHNKDKVCLLRYQHDNPAVKEVILVPTAKSAIKLVCRRLSRCLRNDRGARTSMVRQTQTWGDKAQSGRRASGEAMSWCIAATTLGIRLLIIIR